MVEGQFLQHVGHESVGLGVGVVGLPVAADEQFLLGFHRILYFTRQICIRLNKGLLKFNMANV